MAGRGQTINGGTEMNREETTQAIEVMQAFDEGSKIEHRHVNTADAWKKVIGNPVWSWGTDEYRVKPREPREFLLYPVSTPRKWGVEEDVNVKGWGGGAIKVREVIE